MVMDKDNGHELAVDTNVYRVFLSFVGNNDPFSKDKNGSSTGPGPLLEMLDKMLKKEKEPLHLNDIIIYFTPRLENNVTEMKKQLRERFNSEVKIVYKNIATDSPHKREEILKAMFPLLRETIYEILRGKEKKRIDFFMNISSGTPAMTEFWFHVPSLLDLNPERHRIFYLQNEKGEERPVLKIKHPVETFLETGFIEQFHLNPEKILENVFTYRFFQSKLKEFQQIHLKNHLVSLPFADWRILRDPDKIRQGVARIYETHQEYFHAHHLPESYSELESYSETESYSKLSDKDLFELLFDSEQQEILKRLHYSKKDFRPRKGTLNPPLNSFLQFDNSQADKAKNSLWGPAWDADYNRMIKKLDFLAKQPSVGKLDHRYAWFNIWAVLEIFHLLLDQQNADIKKASLTIAETKLKDITEEMFSLIELAKLEQDINRRYPNENERDKCRDALRHNSMLLTIGLKEEFGAEGEKKYRQFSPETFRSSWNGSAQNLSRVKELIKGCGAAFFVYGNTLGAAFNGLVYRQNKQQKIEEIGTIELEGERRCQFQLVFIGIPCLLDPYRRCAGEEDFDEDGDCKWIAYPTLPEAPCWDEVALNFLKGLAPHRQNGERS